MLSREARRDDFMVDSCVWIREIGATWWLCVRSPWRNEKSEQWDEAAVESKSKHAVETGNRIDISRDAWAQPLLTLSVEYFATGR